MIEIQVPENASYDELVLRTITNTTIKQLCYHSDTLEDLMQAYDLKEKKINRKKITMNDELTIRNLESKYNINLFIIANAYEEYYKLLASIETENLNRCFINFYKSLLKKLDETMLKYGIMVS